MLYHENIVVLSETSHTFSSGTTTLTLNAMQSGFSHSKRLLKYDSVYEDEYEREFLLSLNCFSSNINDEAILSTNS